MEPDIQYTTTSDDVSIAFWTIGNGRPLVVMPPPPFSHILLEWQDPNRRSLYEQLAQTFRLVRYDGRGSGLSEREIFSFSLDDQVLDLQAVVDCLKLDTFALSAQFFAGPVAINYAVHHLDRVSHLFLWCTFARASDFMSAPRTVAIGALADKDWELFTETLAHDRLGWSSGEPARRFAAFMRGCVTSGILQLALGSLSAFDATPLLTMVSCPTLIIHPGGYQGIDIRVSRGLASRIPGARLTVLGGLSPSLSSGDVQSMVGTIYRFLGESEPSEPTQKEHPKRGQHLAEPLTPRELEVLRLIASGMSNQDVADRLVITAGTVKVHLSNIYSKLDVRSRTHAVARAKELSLLE